MIDEAALRGEVGRLLEVLYAKRFAALEKISLKTLLDKNPYLYRALGERDFSALLLQILTARVSSSDETIFGNDFFEPLAKFSATLAHAAGEVSVGAAAGQDVAIETASSYLAISVKSGTNIFNSQSEKGQSAEFNQLQARLKKLNKMFRPIIGYGYGRKVPTKPNAVERIAGQAFWELLTGEPDFYLRISRAIEPFATEHGESYRLEFERKHNLLVKEFAAGFVTAQGDIDWDRIVKFNSGVVRPAKLARQLAA